jgi:hypothetical protein
MTKMNQRLPGERMALPQLTATCTDSPRKHQFRVLSAALYHEPERRDDDPKMTLNLRHDYDNRLMTSNGANWFDNYLTKRFASFGLAVRLIRRLPSDDPTEMRFFVDGISEGNTDRLYSLLRDLSVEGIQKEQSAMMDNQFALAA